MRAGRLAAAVVCLAALVGCSGGPETPAAPGAELRLEAQQDVLVTEQPLGDVVSRDLEAGDVVTALCFVSAAQTNTGARGTAVRTEAGRRPAYVATTDLPDDLADRMPVFDVGEAELRDRLPACPLGG